MQLYLLLFADDAVLFSETRGGLQNNINNLESYYEKWNLIVNMEKTKTVVFRKWGTLGNRDQWFFAGQDIEVVNNFAYLGVGDVESSLNISFYLFDSLVAPVLNYGSEVWASCMLSALKEKTVNFANIC